MLHFPYKAKIPEDIPAVRGGKGASPSRQGRPGVEMIYSPEIHTSNDGGSPFKYGYFGIFWVYLGISYIYLKFFGGY